MVKKNSLIGIDRDLVIALESARTQLAVAIAAERKSTPRDQWHYYLETAERMGRFMRKLRKSGANGGTGSEEGARLQAALRCIPAGASAGHLCRILRDIAIEPE